MMAVDEHPAPALGSVDLGNPGSRLGKRLASWLTLGIPAALVLVFIVLPVSAVLIKSVVTPQGIGLDHYLRFFEKSYYFRSLANSLTLASVTTVILTVTGFVFAFLCVRLPGWQGKFFRVTALMPLVAPPFIFSLALILLAGRNGVGARLLDLDINIYGWTGVICAQVITFLPMAFVMIENVLREVNSDFEAAGANLGANPVRILKDIILPLVMPGIFKAALLIFILAIADFGNPILVGGNVSFLATDAYLLWVGENNPSMAAVFCVFLILPGILIFILHKTWLKNREYPIQGNSDYAPMDRRLLAPFLAIALPLVMVILACFCVIGFGAFTRLIMVDNSFTLAHFLRQTGLRAMGTSLVFAVNSALISTVLGVGLSYLLSRHRHLASGALEFLSLLGFAVPGVVMGIGYLLVFNSPMLALTGTLAIMALNEGFRNLGVGVEAGLGRLQQMDLAVEDAAGDLGAGKLRIFFTIVLPQMKAMILSTFVYTFMVSMVTVSAVIFLIAPGRQLASVYILSVAEQGEMGAACAMSLILIAIVTLCMGLLSLISRITQQNMKRVY